MKKVSFLLILTILFSCGKTSKNSYEKENYDSLFNSVRKRIFSDIDENERSLIVEQLFEIANEGYLPAQVYLGCILVNGSGGNIEKNELLGLEYLLKGLDNNDVEAIFCLAEYYYNEEDILNYQNTLRLGCKLDDVYSLHELGYFLVTGGTEYFANFSFMKWEKKMEIDSGLNLLKRSSRMGNSLSSYRLGIGYLRGQYGLPVDTAASRKYFEQCLSYDEFIYSDQLLEILDEISK
jgi:TPR repeat protein